MTLKWAVTAWNTYSDVQLFVDPNQDPNGLNMFRNQWLLNLLMSFFAIWRSDICADVSVWMCANCECELISITINSNHEIPILF